MKKVHQIILCTLIISTNTFPEGSFLQQLIEAQEARGIRVTTPEEIQFEREIKNLSLQLTTAPQPTQISQNNADQVSTLLQSFYTLFLNPSFIRFSTKAVVNDFFDQLTTWQDALKKSNATIPWPSGTKGEVLKTLLIQGLKEICLFGRYTKHREENLVTFKLRMQNILTNIMMNSSLALWKDELVNNNQQLSLGAFYSWDVALIKAELKDSAALIPLFNKISATVDAEGEKQAAQQHEQELAIEKQQITLRKQQEAQDLRAIVLHIEQQSSTDTVDKETLYLDCLRALLDPAYIDLSVKERKSIDAINEQFKKLHASIGRTFMPILSQEGIDALKLLIAKSLETIYSPMVGKPGGVSLKNHIEFVLKTIMSINPNQTITENQIKFQWIKPLYIDNQFLTTNSKKKLLDIFNNQNFQRWQASVRNFSFKVSSPNTISTPTSIPMDYPVVIPPVLKIEPVSEKVVRPLPSPRTIQQKMPIADPVVEEIVETIPLPKSMQQKMQAKKDAELAAAQKIADEAAIAEATRKAAIKPKKPVVDEALMVEKTPDRAPAAPNTNLKQIGTNLIAQALVAPIDVIKNILANVEAGQKFNLLKTTDDTQYTAVHAAASLARADIIQVLLKDLTPSERYAVITMREKDGQTALHLAAAAKSAPTKGFKPLNAVNELLSGLTLQQKIAFITMQDNDGATALDMAQGSNKSIVISLKEILQKGSK